MYCNYTTNFQLQGQKWFTSIEFKIAAGGLEFESQGWKSQFEMNLIYIWDAIVRFKSFELSEARVVRKVHNSKSERFMKNWMCTMSIALNKLWIQEEDKPRRPDCQRETNYEE